MSDSDIKVSILVPVYGVEKYIARCAESLFKQTYQNIEYIFVNDCTKDSSIVVLEETIHKFPERARMVRIVNHKKNRGLAAARNTAVTVATGDFVMHVDSDDYVDEHIVEKAVRKQRVQDADIVSCNAKKMYAGYTEQMVHKHYHSANELCLDVLRRKGQVCIWGRLIRLSLYRRYNIAVEEGANMGEDYQVIGRLAYYSKKTDVVDECLYYYDCSNESSYSNKFSLEKNRQSWRSFDIVKDFFLPIDNQYAEAVTEGEMNIITSHLIMSSKIKDGKYYYEEARRRLLSIDKKYWKEEPMMRRIVLYLSFNFLLMKAYSQIARWTRHYLKKHGNR